MNGAGLEVFYDPLDLYVWVVSSGSMFHFELLNMIFYWCDLFFLHCLMYFWKENSCHFCVYVALNYWIHCFTIARLEVTLLLARIKTIPRFFSFIHKTSRSRLSFDELYRCFFTQAFLYKTNGGKLMSQCCFFFLHKNQRAVCISQFTLYLVLECFSFLFL